MELYGGNSTDRHTVRLPVEWSCLGITANFRRLRVFILYVLARDEHCRQRRRLHRYVAEAIRPLWLYSRNDLLHNQLLSAYHPLLPIAVPRPLPGPPLLHLLGDWGGAQDFARYELE